jgi:hypothetical protein
MTRVNAKHSIHVDPAATYFEQLSKAALVDILVDVLKREAGDEGHICRESEAKSLAEPVLRLRGDKVPLSTEDQIEKARQAGAARMLYRKAKALRS